MQETYYTVAGCPLSVALVSDLHERPFDAVLASLARNQPALICVAGDFVYGRPPKKALKVAEAGVIPFFSACASIAPCFVSLGNHEWMITDDDFALLRETGAVPLHNAYTVLEREGARLVIGGLSSLRVNAYRLMLAEGLDPTQVRAKTRSRFLHMPPSLDWLDTFCAERGYHLLLCHHPEYYPRYLRERQIELILSGHAHGGQIRLFGQGLFAPGQGLFPKLTSGVTDGRLVVSRGLANCQKVPRLFNPTELVYISGSGQFPEKNQTFDKNTLLMADTAV